MTPEQITAQANVLIMLEREMEALVREQRALYEASLKAGIESPETTRWINRGEQINDQVARVQNAMLRVGDKLTADDARAVNRVVRAEIKDFWYHIPNATPPEANDGR